MSHKLANDVTEIVALKPQFHWHHLQVCGSIKECVILVEKHFERNQHVLTKSNKSYDLRGISKRIECLTPVECIYLVSLNVNDGLFCRRCRGRNQQPPRDRLPLAIIRGTVRNSTVWGLVLPLECWQRVCLVHNAGHLGFLVFLSQLLIFPK